MCVVKGPAQGAMAKTKGEKKRRKKALLSAEEEKAQAGRKNTPPPLRSLEENHALRPLEEDHALRSLEENHALRSSEEDSLRLSGSSEEGVLDTSLSPQSKEQAPESTVSSSAKVEEDKRVMSVTVMTKDKETTAVLTGGGKEQYPLPVQRLIGQAMRFLRPDRPAEQKAVDSAKPVHDDKEDKGHVDVDYEPESPDEDAETALRNQTPAGQALRNGQLPLEHSALIDAQSVEQPAR